jgi:hypothetical protein
VTGSWSAVSLHGLDERARRWGYVAATGIIEVKTREAAAPVVEHGSVQLTPADLREIGAAVSRIKVCGGRMNEEQMKVVDQTA